MASNLETLKTFTTENLPDLDTVALGALELFSSVELPSLDVIQSSKPLVVGSVGASHAGKMIFHNWDAVFANEGTYQHTYETVPGIDAVVLISASGSKHAVDMAEYFKGKKVPLWLLTNNANPPAAEFIDEDHVLVFPKNREPYTYNTSTYLGMILAAEQDSPDEIARFIEREVRPVIPENLSSYNAFTIITPSMFDVLNPMFVIKFEELFGPKVLGRAYTSEEIKHAKTVVSDEKELFISFGEENTVYGQPQNRMHIPLPPGTKFGGMMAIGYYLIGQIQKQHPPYFKESIAAYMEELSTVFAQKMSPIVE